MYALRHGSVYFLRKTKIAVLWIFATSSSAVAYLYRLNSLGHSTVDA